MTVARLLLWRIKREQRNDTHSQHLFRGETFPQISKLRSSYSDDIQCSVTENNWCKQLLKRKTRRKKTENMSDGNVILTEESNECSMNSIKYNPVSIPTCTKRLDNKGMYMDDIILFNKETENYVTEEIISSNISMSPIHHLHDIFNKLLIYPEHITEFECYKGTNSLTSSINNLKSSERECENCDINSSRIEVNMTNQDKLFSDDNDDNGYCSDGESSLNDKSLYVHSSPPRLRKCNRNKIEMRAEANNSTLHCNIENNDCFPSNHVRHNKFPAENESYYNCKDLSVLSSDLRAQKKIEMNEIVEYSVSHLNSQKSSANYFTLLSGRQIIPDINAINKDTTDQCDCEEGQGDKGGESGNEGDDESNGPDHNSGNEEDGKRDESSNSSNGDGGGEGNGDDQNDGNGNKERDDEGDNDDDNDEQDMEEEEEQDSEESEGELNLSVQELVARFEKRSKPDLNVQSEEYFPSSTEVKLENSKKKISREHEQSNKTYNKEKSRANNEENVYTFDTPRNRNAIAFDYVLPNNKSIIQRRTDAGTPSLNDYRNNRVENTTMDFKSKTRKIGEQRIHKSSKSSYETAAQIHHALEIDNPTEKSSERTSRMKNRRAKKEDSKKLQGNDYNCKQDQDEVPRTYMSRASILLARELVTAGDGNCDLNSVSGEWNTDGSSANWVTDNSSFALKTPRKQGTHAKYTNAISESDYGYGEKKKSEKPKAIKKVPKKKSSSALSILHERGSREMVEKLTIGLENTPTYYSNTPAHSIETTEYDYRIPVLENEIVDRNILLNKMLHQENIPVDRNIVRNKISKNSRLAELPNERVNRQNIFIFDSQNEDTDNQQLNSKSVTLVVPEIAIPKRRIIIRKKKRPQEIHSDTSDVNYPVSCSELSIRERLRKEIVKSVEPYIRHQDEVPSAKEKRQKKKVKRSKSKESKTSTSTPISLSSHYYEDEKSLELNALRMNANKTEVTNYKNDTEDAKPKRSLHHTKKRIFNFLKGEYNTIKNHLIQTQENYYSRKGSLTNEPEPPKRTVSLERSKAKVSQTIENPKDNARSKSTPTSRSSSSKRRNVEQESFGVQTDEEQTLDETISNIVPTVQKSNKIKRSDTASSQKNVATDKKKQSNSIYYEWSKLDTVKKSTRSGTKSKDKKVIQKQKSAKKSINDDETIKQYDFQYNPLSASQTLETTSVVTNTSSVRVKRRRSVPKSTFATQTDDEELSCDPNPKSNRKNTRSRKESSSVNKYQKRASICKSTISIQTDIVDIKELNLEVDRSLKPKPKPGPKPKNKIMDMYSSHQYPQMYHSSFSSYINIPAALIYHGINPAASHKKTGEFSSIENIQFPVATVENDERNICSVDVPQGKSDNESLPLNEVNSSDNNKQNYPTILIEPETEEDLPSNAEDCEKFDVRKHYDRNPKDKGKLSERSASREYFRRSFERRGKRSSRYKATQKRREFDIERYGERLIRALEECIRKGELSKEVSEDTKERDIDESSRISSQISKSDEQNNYNPNADVITTEENLIEILNVAISSNENFRIENLCEISEDRNSDGDSLSIDNTSKIPTRVASNNACLSSELILNDNLLSNSELDKTKDSVLVSEVEDSDGNQTADMPVGEKIKSGNNNNLEVDESQVVESKPLAVINRTLTLKRWVSEPSVLPDESSYEFREYKRDLVKALLLIHKQGSKKERGMDEDSLSFDSITREFGSDFDLYAIKQEVSDDQEPRIRSPLVRQDAVEDGEIVHETENLNQKSTDKGRRNSPHCRDDSVDDIDDLEISCDEEDEDENNIATTSENIQIALHSPKNVCIEDSTSEEISILNRNYDERDSTDENSASRLHIQYASEWVSESETAEYYEMEDYAFIPDGANNSESIDKKCNESQLHICESNECYEITDELSILNNKLSDNENIFLNKIDTSFSHGYSPSESEIPCNDVDMEVHLNSSYDSEIREICQQEEKQSEICPLGSKSRISISNSDSEIDNGNINKNQVSKEARVSENTPSKISIPYPDSAEFSQETNIEENRGIWRKYLRKQPKINDDAPNDETDNTIDCATASLSEETSFTENVSENIALSKDISNHESEDSCDLSCHIESQHDAVGRKSADGEWEDSTNEKEWSDQEVEDNNNGQEMEEDSANYFAISRQETSREIERQRSSKSSKSSGEIEEYVPKHKVEERTNSAENNLPTVNVKVDDKLECVNLDEAEISTSTEKNTSEKTENDKSNELPQILECELDSQKYPTNSSGSIREVTGFKVGSVRTRERRKRKKKLRMKYKQHENIGSNQFEKLDELFDKNLKANREPNLTTEKCPAIPIRTIAPKAHYPNENLTLISKYHEMRNNTRSLNSPRLDKSRPVVPPRTKKREKYLVKLTNTPISNPSEIFRKSEDKDINEKSARIITVLSTDKPISAETKIEDLKPSSGAETPSVKQISGGSEKHKMQMQCAEVNETSETNSLKELTDTAKKNEVLLRFIKKKERIKEMNKEKQIEKFNVKTINVPEHEDVVLKESIDKQEVDKNQEEKNDPDCEEETAIYIDDPQQSAVVEEGQ